MAVYFVVSLDPGTYYLVLDNQDNYDMATVSIWVNSEYTDSDQDGTPDGSDSFPFDPSASADSDNDGYPDNWNEGMGEKDSNQGLKLDHFPNDPEKWKKEDSPGFEIGLILIVSMLIGLTKKLRNKMAQ